MPSFQYLAVLAAVATVVITIPSRSEPLPLLTPQVILDTLHPDCLGCGTDMYTDDSSEHAMAFALLASAGTEMGNEVLARTAADWLVANNGTSTAPAGWGLSFSWDAFADGSVNPESTVYGITTALAARGLMDVYELTGDQRYLNSAQSALTYYSQFFTTTNTGGYFWYSDQQSDDINVFNVSSMLMGQFARIGAKVGDERMLTLARMARSDLLSHVQSEGPYEYWIYDPARPNQKPNDAVHAAYVVQGLADFAAAMGSEPPAGPQVDYLTTFASNSTPLTWSTVHDLPARLSDQTAKLWGTGMLIFTLADTDQNAEAMRYAEMLQEYYLPQVGFKTSIDGSADSDPRMVTHALLGIARLHSSIDQSQH